MRGPADPGPAARRRALRGALRARSASCPCLAADLAREADLGAAVRRPRPGWRSASSRPASHGPGRFRSRSDSAPAELRSRPSSSPAAHRAGSSRTTGSWSPGRPDLDGRRLRRGRRRLEPADRDRRKPSVAQPRGGSRPRVRGHRGAPPQLRAARSLSARGARQHRASISTSSCSRTNAARPSRTGFEHEPRIHRRRLARHDRFRRGQQPRRGLEPRLTCRRSTPTSSSTTTPSCARTPWRAWRASLEASIPSRGGRPADPDLGSRRSPEQPRAQPLHRAARPGTRASACPSPATSRSPGARRSSR